MKLQIPEIREIRKLLRDRKDTLRFLLFVFAVVFLISYLSSIRSIPANTGERYAEMRGGFPSFSAADLRTTSAVYGGTNAAGQPTTALLCVCKETLAPPSSAAQGDGEGFIRALIGENLGAAADQTRVKMTRRLCETMEDFEAQVYEYVQSTDNRVIYRATAAYDTKGTLLGVELEGFSVEDNGAGICFHVFAFD